MNDPSGVRKDDKPIREVNTKETAKRTMFLFGKDLSPQAIAEAINKATGRTK